MNPFLPLAHQACQARVTLRLLSREAQAGVELGRESQDWGSHFVLYPF